MHYTPKVPKNNCQFQNKSMLSWETALVWALTSRRLRRAVQVAETAAMLARRCSSPSAPPPTLPEASLPNTSRIFPNILRQSDLFTTRIQVVNVMIRLIPNVLTHQGVCDPIHLRQIASQVQIRVTSCPVRSFKPTSSPLFTDYDNTIIKTLSILMIILLLLLPLPIIEQ